MTHVGWSTSTESSHCIEMLLRKLSTESDAGEELLNENLVFRTGVAATGEDGGATLDERWSVWHHSDQPGAWRKNLHRQTHRQLNRQTEEDLTSLADKESKKQDSYLNLVNKE